MANAISISVRQITIVPDGSTDFDITTVQSNMVALDTVVGNFTVGETVTQATSGATGVVYSWDAKNQVLYLVSMAGVFDATHVITGGSSAAHGIPVGIPYGFARGIRLTAVDFYHSGTNDVLIIREGKAVGSVIYKRMDVAGGGVHQAVEGKSRRRLPYIVAADCSFAAPANAKIILEYD